uniref:arsenate reductase (glutaredoxin) n=1 Tax=Ningiella ruwaisensis TaxID=2364274 RepID=UPI0010A038F4|nr:arsenate reductase (glutaredoxin) [Ningiella ruwaisensis]
MPNAILYHNPRCSKSREAKAFVEQHIDNLQVIEYLKHPLSKQELEALYNKMDLQSAHQMLRPKEDEYKLAKLSETSSNDEVFEAIANYPKLLERPILEYGDKAAIGRPLDHIISLLHA